MVEVGELGPTCPGCGRHPDGPHPRACYVAWGQIINPGSEPVDVHECAPPMRDVMVRAPVGLATGDAEQADLKPVKIGATPDANPRAVWRCTCGAIWRVEWQTGLRYPGGAPVYGRPGTQLYVNLMTDHGWVWRRRRGIVAWWLSR